MHRETKSSFELLNEHLSSPHFDDERTILSARRVVPLSAVAGRWWRPRPGILALILGSVALVLVAILLWSFRLKTLAPVLGTESGARAEATISGEAMAIETEPIAPNSNEPEPERFEEHRARQLPNDGLAARRPTPKVNLADKEKSKIRVRRQPAEAPQLEGQPETRERRTQREGIFRIGEIFEGSERPNE